MFDLAKLFEGLVIFFEPLNLSMSVIGIWLGLIFGSLPGFTATMGVAVLVPVTYWMHPSTGLLMLSGIYCGAIYGGSISAVLLGIPGTPASVPTTFDGYALTRQGKAGKALAMATWASAVGGLLSALALILGAPVLAMWALKFGPPEVLALAVFGLSVISLLSAENLLKGIITALFGLAVATIGQDPVEGYMRLTFGIYQLVGGVPLIPLLIGLFSLPPAFELAEGEIRSGGAARLTGSILVTFSEIRRTFVTVIRSSLIGIGIGIIPGAGPDIAAFVAYNEAVRSSKNPEKFGKGALEGIAASESANNGVTGGSLIPLLTLGIPGSAPAAIFLGTLFIHGLRPGPMLFQNNPQIIYTVLVGFAFINVFMYFLGILYCRITSQVVRVPAGTLVPLIITLTVAGSYGIGATLFDVWVMFISGLVGYLMLKNGFPAAPVVLAVILGPMMEANLELTILMTHGNFFSVFITRPLAALFFLMAAVMLMWPLIRKWNSAQKRRRKSNSR